MTWLTSVFVRVGRLFMRVLLSRRSGTWPSPSPTWTTMIGTFVPSTRVMRLRSPSTSRWTRGSGPSVTRATPGRPIARKTRSRVRGSTATGSSSTYQPRRMFLRTAPTTPGWPAIRW